MDDVDPLIGKQVGNYHILAKINSGSFGSVYQGKHIIFDDDPIVAIKLLHTTFYTQQERTEFIQEARILKKLQHPHILRILDAGFQDGIPYLVTEYAAGSSLRAYLDSYKCQLISLQKSVTILAQIGQALHYAHQQYVVHRDLKPENILFNGKGEALLADFGIAAVLSTAKTKQIGLGGTPAYMAPEQFEGLISSKSDQYALGCIGYELFTGHKPFNVASPNMEALWYHHAKVNPVPPREHNTLLPIYIEQAILRAMSKNRSDRFDNVATFITTICSPFSRSDDITLFQTSRSASSSSQTSILYDVSDPRDVAEAKRSGDLYSRLLNEHAVEIAVPIKPVQKHQFRSNDTLAPKHEEEELFQLLRALRKQLADEAGVAPYVVFPDTSLRSMAQRRPQSRSQFAQIPGVGSSKLEAYFEAFTNEIRDYCLSHNLKMDIEP